MTALLVGILSGVSVFMTGLLKVCVKLSLFQNHVDKFRRREILEIKSAKIHVYRDTILVYRDAEVLRHITIHKETNDAHDDTASVLFAEFFKEFNDTIMM